MEKIMIDILEMPTETFTLSRKDILQKLWSAHAKKPDAASHLLYFALWAALVKPENQAACLEVAAKAAFTPISNKVKLANGATPRQSLIFAQAEAGRRLHSAITFREHPNYVKPADPPGRYRVDAIQFVIDRFKRDAAASEFHAQVTNFCTLEELRAAANLLGQKLT
jgi:hypothetical protein